jgi:hypothetical protein
MPRGFRWDSSASELTGGVRDQLPACVDNVCSGVCSGVLDDQAISGHERHVGEVNRLMLAWLTARGAKRTAWRRARAAEGRDRHLHHIRPPTDSVHSSHPDAVLWAALAFVDHG